MTEKETQEFSRESFKDKILRQLEKEKDSSDTEASSAKTLSTPSTLSSSVNAQTDETFEAKQEKAHHQFLQASNEPYHSEKKNHATELIDGGDKEGAMSASKKQSLSRKKVMKSDSENKSRKQTNASSPKNGKKQERGKKKNTAGKIIAVIVLVLLLAALATGWYGYHFVKTGVEPLNQSDHTITAVNIPAGSSSKQIGDLLQKRGIIKNGMVFQYYTKFKNYTGFKSGYYNLSPNMTLSAIATLLEKGGTPKPVEPVLGKITIPEGYTLKQISQAITKNADTKNGKTPFTTAAFMKIVQDPTFIAKMKAKYPTLFASLPTTASGVKYQLEGYLFPATYEYTKKSTIETIVASMVEAMNANLSADYAQIATNGMTVNSTLSLAALVEKEANNDADRRNVAGVFYNRLNVGMALESNVSVLYAEGKLGDATTLKQDVTLNTSTASPYNLYLHTGTGPGPVDNPSLSSIKAVLNPTKNDDYYFVADVTTGKVYFAKTLAEQTANVQKYVNDKLK